MFSDTLEEYESLFIPLNLECFRTGGKKPEVHEAESLFTDDTTPVKAKVVRIVEPCVSALIRSSGISRHQAKTCFYYALATHLLPDNLELMPILAIIGALGTGKSWLLSQIAKMVNQPKLIGAESQSTLRDELDGTVTALLDEGDRVYEPYLQRRYAKDTSRISYKKEAGDIGWRKVEASGRTAEKLSHSPARN